MTASSEHERDESEPGVVGAVLRLRSTWLALAIGAATSGLACLSPLVGSLGIESSLVLGVVLPPFVGILGARVATSARARDDEAPFRTLATRALFGAWVVLVLSVGILAIHGAAKGSCAPLEGLAFEVLGPGFGVSLVALVGLAIGLLVPKPKLATWLAALAPLAAYGWSFIRFYTTPAIFVYSQFAGYFPGTIYDENVRVSPSYVALRIVTTLWCGAIVTALGGSYERIVQRVSLGRGLASGGILVALVLGGAALAGHIHGNELGVDTSSAWIASELGGRAYGRRCTAVVPRELDHATARRLVDDCDFRIEQTERWLGVRQAARVTAFFFRSAEEKRRLMGAEGTYVAKPWRNEVYLQIDRVWPHPVLAHEIAHVVAGNLGPGPFHVSGGLRGMVPNPGLIEGLAVAAAWNGREDLTPHEWAAAMIEIGVAPHLSSVMGTSFLLQSGSSAYTLSGSFVRWVYETRGAAAVRRLYATNDVEATLGEPLDALERKWRAWLRARPLERGALAMARQRFARSGLFSELCPHRIAELHLTLEADLGAGDDRAVVHTCSDVLGIDPNDANARIALIGSLARLGRGAQATAELEALEKRGASPTTVASARTELADALWFAGHDAQAAAMYRRIVQESTLSPDDLRAIELKAWAIESGDARTASLVRSLLVGDEGNGPPDGAVAVHIARELAAARTDGLGAYLEARQMMNRERYDLAYDLLRAARARGLPTERLTHEAARMLGTCAYATGRTEEARQVFRAIANDPSSSEATKADASDWLERIAWRARRARSSTNAR